MSTVKHPVPYHEPSWLPTLTCASPSFTRLNHFFKSYPTRLRSIKCLDSAGWLADSKDGKRSGLGIEHLRLRDVLRCLILTLIFTLVDTIGTLPPAASFPPLVATQVRRHMACLHIVGRRHKRTLPNPRRSTRTQPLAVCTLSLLGRAVTGHRKSSPFSTSPYFLFVLDRPLPIPVTSLLQ